MIRLITSFLLFIAAAPAFAADMSHLREMPSVDRVMGEITADDRLGAAARRMGAFALLQEMVEDLSEGRTAVGTETPDEKRILQGYRDAYYAVQMAALGNPPNETLLPQLRRYDTDDMLLTGKAHSLKDIATSAELDRSDVGRIFALAFLSPSVTRDIVSDRQHANLNLKQLIEVSAQISWQQQHAAISRAASAALL
jgi:hypothetical protein